VAAAFGAAGGNVRLVAAPPVFTDMAARVRNWGRWGPEDEVGTLNLIDDAARRRGAAAVVSGRAFGLGLPLSEAEGIQLGFVEGRVNPTRTMVQVNQPVNEDQPEWVCFSEDVLSLATQCATHWDALAHASYGGVLYNGYPASTVDAQGAGRCGIHRLTTVVGRGVLLDVARARGVDVLDPGYAITPDDLTAACDLAGTATEPGDIVLVRTGQMIHLIPDRRDLVAYTYPSPGLSIETAEWFFQRDVAAVATDNLTFEVYPCQYDDLYLPVHLLHLVEMGLTQGQNWVLDALAADCADDGQYTFLLDATPLGFTNALGSPLNPVALK
jgi:kynurenine formamidase